MVVMITMQMEEAKRREKFLLSAMKEMLREMQADDSMAVRVLADDLNEFIEDFENGCET